MRHAGKRPVTAERIEQYLDKLAQMMAAADPPARELLIPIWQRLERELASRQETSAILAAADARLRRSKDRTATPS